MDRTLVVAGSVAFAAVVAALIVWPASPDPPPVEILSAADLDRTVTVHVSGEVSRPGLVTVGSDARVADAIVAAGGATPDAELSALNLAAAVGDGTRLVVPAKGDAGTPAGGDGMIRLNSASVVELEGLPGVGPVLAERIAAHRDENGSFESVEDLLDVPGIGEAKLAAIRDVVLVP